MAASSSPSIVKLACIVVLACMLIGASPMANAITCGQVASALAPCINYLKGGAFPPNCCNGVRGLNNAAKSTPDRQMACSCLKSLNSQFKVIPALASGLPGKCGVNIPYKISPSTDCSKVK